MRKWVLAIQVTIFTRITPCRTGKALRVVRSSPYAARALITSPGLPNIPSTVTVSTGNDEGMTNQQRNGAGGSTESGDQNSTSAGSTGSTPDRPGQTLLSTTFHVTVPCALTQFDGLVARLASPVHVNSGPKCWN